MDTSIISKKVDSYKKVSDSKAGLKDVYIIKSSGDKYVLSKDTGTGWNWLSEQYIEPVVIQWVNKKQVNVSPNIVEYDINDKIMLTEYTGDSDLSDIDFGSKQMCQLGELIGRTHNLGDFGSFGGITTNDNKNIITQKLSWKNTLRNILEKVDKFPSSDISIKNTIKQRIQKVDEDGVSPCFSHGDLRRLSNVRVDNSSNIDSLVDWQNAWVSDGLIEFLYARMCNFTPHYSGEKVVAFTDGYMSNAPDSVKELTDEQATISLFIALTMMYDTDSYEKDLVKFFQSFYNTDKSISTNKILDPSNNIKAYL